MCVKLRNWLETQNIKICDFAKDMKIDLSWASQVVNGRVPSAKMMKQIEAYTAGCVTASDLLKGHYSRKREHGAV